MSFINALVAIGLVMVFLAGVAFGVFVTVCASLNREDRWYSLRGTPPDSAAAGTRILVGVGTRDIPASRPPRHPGEQVNQGWERGE